MGVKIQLVLIFSLLFCAFAQGQKNPTLHKLSGDAYTFYLNKPDSALKLTQRALDLAILSKDLYYEGYCYFLFSRTYWVKTNYKLSTEYGFKALKIFQDTPHVLEMSSSLLSLARTFTELGNFQKADQFIHQALRLGAGNSEAQAEAYRELSFLLTELNQLDSALYYSDKGITLYEKLGDSINISVLYGRKSRIYFQQKDFEKSKQFAYNGMAIDSLVNNRRGLGIAYFQAAQNEYALQNKEKAITQLKHSLRINGEIGNLAWLIKSHELLSSFYLNGNKPELAAAELQKVSHYKDVLYNSEKSGQIQEMQSLHELEAKENKIKLLEQTNALKQQEVKNQRLFLAFLLVAMLLLVLLIFVLTRLRSIQNKTNHDLTVKNIAIEQQRHAIQAQAENLRQLDHLKTKLFSAISHDLRGPVANLQALLDMFTKRLVTANEFIVLSEKLKENLNVTQRTLENLLNWALSQMDGIKTEKKKIDIGSSIEEACLLMEEDALRKNVRLHKQFYEPLFVYADSDQLQLILRNLIHNAIKFSTLNDRIHIRALRENDHCQVTIKDSGTGMSQDEIEALTGSKKHFSKEGTLKEKGTGLGFMLCKEFIFRNGGVFKVKSAIGAGTEVSFTLMLAENYN